MRCPACAYELSPEATECPNCGIIPSKYRPRAKPSLPLPSSPRTCPFCAEEIQGGAVLCRFCNRAVADPAVQQAAVEWATLPQKRRDFTWARFNAEQKRELTALLEALQQQPKPILPAARGASRSSDERWVFGCILTTAAMGLFLVLMLALSDRPASRGIAAPAPVASGATVLNEKNGDPRDVQQAKRFLNELPPACDGSSAFVSTTDGAVHISVRCKDGRKAVDSHIVIKDGKIRDLR